MQEVKVDVVSNAPGMAAQVLKQYIEQGFTVDAFSVEVPLPTSQSKVVTTVMHRERTGQWN